MQNNVFGCYGQPGKDIPNVFFCGGQYFDEFYKEICKLGRISLWYDRGMFEIDESVRRFELEQMNLFIVPVTNSLLENPPQNYVNDYSFALSKGIPVLPIAFEPIDDTLYSYVFGKRHYLVYDSKNGATLSFLEKLESYLSTLLVSPELVERIKKAFGGRVFLSYRKKDRMHIPSIMKAIHSNENLIDIAVWYDEFLTPGENFDDNIEQKMKESDAFLLSVTPNLLEEGNYVMSSEYPFAVKENMLILPIEVEKTESSDLEKYYPHIPQRKSIERANEISEALAQNLISRREKKSLNRLPDPERDYLLGLAYIFGIDVEVDRERGFRLIERAADAGYEEAMSKLSAQNLRGGGIDSKIARGRQQRYVDICRERYEREGTVNSICEYADALEALANIEDSFVYYDYHCESENANRPIPEASVFMVELLERECAKNYSEKLIHRLVDAYTVSARFYSGRARTSVSDENDLKSIELLKQIAEKNPSSEIYLEIAKLYASFVADGYIGLRTAMHYHIEALKFYRKSYGNDRRIECLKTYFELCDDIGNAAVMCGWDEEIETGAKYWTLALNIMEEIFEREPTEKNASILCEKYVHYCEEFGDRVDRFYAFDAEVRIHYCNRAIEICNRYLGAMYGENLKGILIFIHFNMADAYFELEKYENALDNYKAAINLYEPYLENVLRPRVYANLNDTLKMGSFGCFKCLANLNKMTEANPYAYYLISTFELAASDYEIFIDEWIKHRDSCALKQFSGESLTAYCNLVWKKAEGNRYWKERCLNELHNRFSKAYEICLEAEFHVVAATYLSMAATALQKNVGNNREKISDLVKICIKIGDLYYDHFANSDAYNWYLAGVNNAKLLINDEISLDEVRLVAFANIKMGEYHEQIVEFDLAENYYTYAYKCMGRIYWLTKDRAEINDIVEKLSRLYAKQGNIFYALKKTAALSKMIRKGK